MNLADKRVRVALVVGVLAALAVVSLYVVVPLAGKWSELGSRLKPRLEQVGQLRARVQGQDGLLARRDALARRLGSLLGSSAPAAEAAAPGGDPAPESPQPSPDKPQSTMDSNAGQTISVAAAPDASPPSAEAAPATPNTSPDSAQGTAAAPATPAPPNKTEQAAAAPAAAPQEAPGAPAPASEGANNDTRLAAYLEKAAAESGVKIKRISARKGAGGQREGKHFRAVALQMTLEGKMPDVAKLLYAVEKGDRFVRIDQIEFRRDVKKGDQIDASLDISGYER